LLILVSFVFVSALLNNKIEKQLKAT